MSTSSRIPWITLLLIGANLIPAFAVLFDPLWIERLGFRVDAPSVGSALTSMFLHLNVLHLMGNMLFLAAVGPAVELSAGWWRFLVVYFVGGLAGAAVHLLVLGQAQTLPPLIGASGAIAACIGYACVRFLHMKVPLTPRLNVPVYSVALIWATLQIVGAFVRIGDPFSGVSFWAHLGGFATGIIMSLIFRAPECASVEIGHEAIAAMGGRGPAAVKSAAELHLRTHPKDIEAWQELADACHLLGEAEPERTAVLRLIELAPEGDQAPLYERLADRGGLARVPSNRRTALAERYKESDPKLSRKLLASVVDGPKGDVQRPDAILSLATLTMTDDASTAEALLKELQTNYPLHPATEVARTKGLVQ